MSSTGLLDAPQTTDRAGDADPVGTLPQPIKLTEIVLSLIAGTLFAWWVLGPVEGKAPSDASATPTAAESTEAPAATATTPTDRATDKR